VFVTVRRNRAWRGCLFRLTAAISLVRACVAVAAAGTAASASNAPFYATTFEKAPTVAAMTVIGRELFFDTGLSASGRIACATCHVPGRDFGPPDDASVQRGGSNGR